MNRVCLNVITGALFFIGVTAHAEPVEKIDINLQHSNPNLATQWEDKKEVKGFNHLTHIQTLKKGSPDQDICLTCHKEVTKGDEIQQENRMKKQEEVVIAAGGVKKYMHGNCVTCHKTLKKQKETTGPTSCKGCH